MSRTDLTGERLQKYLAALGVGSRRKVDGWISAGKITVNGRVARPGDRVTSGCRIKIDGRPLRGQSRSCSLNSQHQTRQRVILYNKPEGEICTRSDPENRPTVFRNLPWLTGQRWVAVGRLDINTRGLMFLTNDGDLANHLMHPRLELEREYLCRVYGQVDKSSIARLKQGITMDGQMIRFHEVRYQRGESSNSWYSVTLRQGRYREVRRMWDAIGCKLSRLSRIRYGKVALPRGLKSGNWVELGPALIELLAKNREKDDVVVPKLLKKSSRRSNPKICKTFRSHN